MRLAEELAVQSLGWGSVGDMAASFLDKNSHINPTFYIQHPDNEY